MKWCLLCLQNLNHMLCYDLSTFYKQLLVGCIECNAVYSYRWSLHLSVSLQSVCPSFGSSRLHCAKVAEQIKMLFGVNTPGDPWNIVLGVGPDPPQREVEGPVLNLGTPLLSSEWLKLQNWNFACIPSAGGPNENDAKVGHNEWGLGHVTYF